MRVIFLALGICVIARAEFELQFIGNSIHHDEAAARNFCDSKFCIGDSQILFYAATQNSSVDPCLDFKEFSMGTLIKYRALHERYFAVGLSQDVTKMHEERLRKLLATKSKDEDPRVFKVMRNFFEKCVSSKNVKKNGKKEMLDHLKSLGGSPYLNGASWDPSKFNISRIIEAEPYYGVLILLDYDLQTDFTPDGYNKTERILALIKEGIDSTDEGEMGTVRHFKEMLVDMEDLHEGNSTYRDDIEAKIDVAVGNLQKYRDAMKNHRNQSTSELIKVKKLKESTPNLQINWLQVLNDQLLRSLKLTEDDEIYFKYPDTMKTWAAALETMDKGVIADAFAIKFMYFHRFLSIVYPFDWKDAEYTSNSRAKQRWEQCLVYVEKNMRPALELMQSLSGERDSKKVDEFVREAVRDFVETIKSVNETVLSTEAREKTVEKLNKINVVTEIFNRNLTISTLDDYYEDLKLKGDENLVKSALEIESFYMKIRHDYRDLFEEGSRSQMDSASQSDVISYNTLTDVFTVPAVLTYYPWFHPDRPRFFNQATLYLDIVQALKAQTVRYISNVIWADALPLHDGLEEFTYVYDKYLEWEAKGGKDLLLGANRLMTHQLFWLSLARSRYRKQKFVSGVDIGANAYDKTFFWFKNKWGPLEPYARFQEAFNCKPKKE